MVRPDYLRANKEPQTEALPAACGRTPPERLKNGLLAPRRYRLPVVPDFDNEIIVSSAGGDFDGTVRSTVDQGIADQMGGELLNPSDVASHSAPYRDVREDLALMLRVLKLLYDRPQGRIDVGDVLDPDAHSTAQPAPGKVEYIVNQ
jgi:hypothetical protein